MNTFTNKIDENLKEEYDSLIFDFFEGRFDDEKRELIDQNVTKIVEKHDFKVLCAFLHVFIDNIICEQIMKKDCYGNNLNDAYIYFMKSIDAYFELPNSYYENKVVAKKTGDTYYNYYVNLRTLIDHNLITYKNDKLNPKVKCYLTNMGKAMAKKPIFDITPDSVEFNKTFDLIKKYYPNRNTKETYKILYDSYLVNKNKLEGYDIIHNKFLTSVHSSLQYYEEARFNDICFEVIKRKDLKLLLYIYFEIAEFANKYAFHCQRFFSILSFAQLIDVLKNIYACEKDIATYGDEELPWGLESSEDQDLFDILKTFVALFMFFTIDAQDIEFNIVLKYEREIFDFISTLIRVNKNYTDILGKSLDQFFISYFIDLFDPDTMVLDFGVRTASIDLNALIYLASTFCYFNNITSMDYYDDIEENIDKSYNEFLYPVQNQNFYADDESAIGECSRFTKFFLDQLIEYYVHFYGARYNPLNMANNNIDKS